MKKTLQNLLFAVPLALGACATTSQDYVRAKPQTLWNGAFKYFDGKVRLMDGCETSTQKLDDGRTAVDVSCDFDGYFVSKRAIGPSQEACHRALDQYFNGGIILSRDQASDGTLVLSRGNDWR